MLDVLAVAAPKLVEPDYPGAFRYLAARNRKRALTVVFTDVIDRLARVEEVLLVVEVEERVDRRMPAAVHLHERAVATEADRGPDSDHRAATEHLVGDLERDRVDVVLGEVVVPGPHEAVQGALDVGEERVTAQPGAQPDRADLDGSRDAVEADREGVCEQLAARLGLPGLAAGRVPGRRGLHADVALGEGE